jgi:hypothetical protein
MFVPQERPTIPTLDPTKLGSARLIFATGAETPPGGNSPRGAFPSGLPLTCAQSSNAPGVTRRPTSPSFGLMLAMSSAARLSRRAFSLGGVHGILKIEGRVDQSQSHDQGLYPLLEAHPIEVPRVFLRHA